MEMQEAADDNIKLTDISYAFNPKEVGSPKIETSSKTDLDVAFENRGCPLNFLDS